MYFPTTIILYLLATERERLEFPRSRIGAEGGEAALSSCCINAAVIDQVWGMQPREQAYHAVDNRAHDANLHTKSRWQA